MFKRLFSKKSGFTLVEIIVAFAVFAIMSTTIMQMLAMISRQRASNIKYAQEVDNQEKYLVTHDKATFDPSRTPDGKIELDFGEGGKFSADYQMNGTNDDGSVDGLRYFVSKEAERTDVGGSTTPPPADEGDGDDDAGAQTDRVRARITGTSGFDFISIDRIEKSVGKQVSSSKQSYWECEKCHTHYNSQYEGYNVCPAQPAGHGNWANDNICNTFLKYKEETITTESEETYYIYYFEVSAQTGSSVSSKEYPYANYRIYFYDASGNPCEIVYANYLNVTTLSGAESLSSDAKSSIDLYSSTLKNSPHQDNPYTAAIVSNNGIRIGSPFSSDGVKFESGKKTRFEVAFLTDPQLDVTSFGENGDVMGDGSCVYHSGDTLSNGVNIGSNIYGAYPKS